MLGNAKFRNTSCGFLDDTMKSIQINCTFKGSSGYDQLARGLTRQLLQHDYKIQLIDIPHFFSRPLSKDKLPCWLYDLEKPIQSDITLHICMPTQLKKNSRKLNVLYTMFEADRVIPQWVHKSLQSDLIVLPTESSQDAWTRSGFPKELIRLCPHGVDPTVFDSTVEPLKMNDKKGKPISEYSVRILNVSDITPRKNLLSLLKVWLATTGKTDDAILILKLNCGSEKKLLAFYNDLHNLESAVGKKLKDAAPVRLALNHYVEPEKMPQFYAMATHYWSMSHGEGWDLPMTEAGAMGLCLIAPAHTAYLAYLDESVAYMIPSYKVPAIFYCPDKVHKFFKNAYWHQPDEAVASSYIEQAVRETLPPRSAQQRIVQQFTWEKAGLRFIDILEEAARHPVSKYHTLDYFKKRFFAS
jgi:glycosyltransferase involved in cell wall biosynthesis